MKRTLAHAIAPSIHEDPEFRQLLKIAAVPVVLGIVAIGWAVWLNGQPSKPDPVDALAAIHDLGPDQGLVSSSRPKAGAAAGATQRNPTPASSLWRSITFSVYSDFYDGRRAADGSRFSQKGLTCACNSVPLGTELDLQVGGRWIHNVKVTDRMAKRFTDKRIDLSAHVWQSLGGGKPGLMKGSWRVSK